MILIEHAENLPRKYFVQRHWKLLGNWTVLKFHGGEFSLPVLEYRHWCLKNNSNFNSCRLSLEAELEAEVEVEAEAQRLRKNKLTSPGTSSSLVLISCTSSLKAVTVQIPSPDLYTTESGDKSSFFKEISWIVNNLEDFEWFWDFNFLLVGCWKV